MFLVAGSDNDPNTRRLIDQAHIYDIPYQFIDVSLDEIPSVHWNLGEREISINEHTVVPDALYLRHDVFSSDRDQWSLILTQNLSAYASGRDDVKVLNKARLHQYNDKHFNLLLANMLGLKIPLTKTILGLFQPGQIMGNTPFDAIIKPAQGGDYTIKFDPSHEPDRPYHHFLQEFLPGDNFRVFVIGTEIFGFRILTENIDYRTDKSADIEVISVEDSLAQKCLEMASKLNMNYCAHDFRANEAGQWVYLETNSFPMFVAFDDVANNQLANAQLRELGYNHIPA